MIRLLLLNNLPILEQLHLEEALLRVSNENWCLLNTGSPPAIVMGISGKPERLLHVEKAAKDRIPLIKRFSGGGTVYIDAQTVFATFIFNTSFLHVPAQPKTILKWSESLYQPLFANFSLRENDYVFGEKKFGGNALYIQKNRWLLHTSFLWDYSDEKMEYLTLPEKRPEYRKDRSHADFLCSLKSLYPKKEYLIEAMAKHIGATFPSKQATLQEAQTHLYSPHRTSTKILSL